MTYTIKATVETTKFGDGGTLKLRKKKHGTTIFKIPNGSTVYVATLEGEWLPTQCSLGSKTYTGYVLAKFIQESNVYNSTTSNQNISVQQYLSNLESFCNCGWTYQEKGCNYTTKQIDCSNYPYQARNRQGGKGCTIEYDNYLTQKGTIASLGGYDGLQIGMEVFQGNDKTKGHMGVYAGKFDFDGTGNFEHAVYQSCTKHLSIKTKYNQGVPGDSGPNLTSMNNRWLYWGWSKFINH